VKRKVTWGRAWTTSWTLNLALGIAAGGLSIVHAELVDRIAAVVNGHLLTASDLVAYHNLFAPELQSSEEAMRYLIDRQLLIEEADRFAIDQPAASAVDQRVQSTVLKLGGADAFRRLLERVGWNADILRAWIADDLRIADFLDQRIYFFVVISPDEVTAYYDAHADEFAGLTLDQVRESIVQRLTQQRGDEKRRQFMTKLREKAAIQINPPVGPGESTPTRPAH
jgi:hypothetical protein